MDFVEGDADYRDAEFSGRELTFNRKGRVRVGGIRLSNCTIRIEKKVQLLLVGSEFRECHIHCESIAATSAQHSVLFRDCTFHGHLRDWRFGGRGPGPTVVSCDFRDADLHDCEFADADMRQQRFRGWPTIVFLDIERNAERIRKVRWPKGAEVQIWTQTLLSRPAAGCAMNANLAARWMKIDAATLRTVVEQLGEAVLF